MSNQPTNRYALIIIGILFFAFGFVTWLNGTLIPFLKLACELKSETEAFFVTSAFYMAYFFLAIPSSYILKKTGYKNGMALGLGIMALGSLLFIPAANSRNFPLFLAGLFIQGTGLAILQTASNPYISILGPIESAARRISIMGICNKVAGIVSPLVLSALVLKNASEIEEKLKGSTDGTARLELLDQLAGRVIPPYIVIAVVLILLAIMIVRSRLPEVDTEQGSGKAEATRKNVLQYRHLVLGIVCIFMYVGVEVIAGDAIGSYGRGLGLPLDETKYFTTFTLCGMLLGYLIGIITIPKYISQQNALAISAITGVVFSVCVFFTSGYVAITFIALLGLANSLMWPAIFPLAIAGLGKFTNIGSALLIMGIAGGGILPVVYTTLRDEHIASNEVSFLICVLPCYLYIFYYAVQGHRIRKEDSFTKTNTIDSAV